MTADSSLQEGSRFMSVPPAIVLTVADLERIVSQTEPAALLVAPRILRRVIKKDRGLTGPGLQVPHRKSYVIDRERLLRIADRDELGVESGRDLPPTLLLFPRPDTPRLSARKREATLVKYWRLLFHARVHLALQARPVSEGEVRARIRRIGLTEFDEAMAVLRQEHFLLPPDDARTVYEEFTAVYLELRYFAPHLLPVYFPTCAHRETIEATLAVDVDAAGLFAATRLEGAPDPVAMPEARDGEEGASAPCSPVQPGADAPRSPQAYRRLLDRADRADSRGNMVRAAIFRMRAVPLAPSGQADAIRAAARGEIEQFSAPLAEGARLLGRGRRRLAAGAAGPARTGGARRLAQRGPDALRSAKSVHRSGAPCLRRGPRRMVCFLGATVDPALAAFPWPGTDGQAPAFGHAPPDRHPHPRADPPPPYRSHDRVGPPLRAPPARETAAGHPRRPGQGWSAAAPHRRAGGARQGGRGTDRPHRRTRLPRHERPARRHRAQSPQAPRPDRTRRSTPLATHAKPSAASGT